MSQKLFNLPKIGVFLDGFSPSTEERRGEDTKVVVLSLRVQPFSVKHAIAIDDGLGEDSNVRQALFNLTNDEPKPHLERVNLALGCPPQTLLVHAAPDAPEARIAFTQCKIAGTYARTQKDIQGYAFCFKATFGPVGADDLAFLQHWFLSQQFVTFEAAQPLIDDVVANAPTPPSTTQRPPMWDDGDEMTPTPAEEAPPTPKARGTRKKTARHDPEAEAAAQAAGNVADDDGPSLDDDGMHDRETLDAPEADEVPA